MCCSQLRVLKEDRQKRLKCQEGQPSVPATRLSKPHQNAGLISTMVTPATEDTESRKANHGFCITIYFFPLGNKRQNTSNMNPALDFLLPSGNLT